MVKWEKMQSNLITRLARRIKGEECFIHSSHPQYSLCLKHPFPLTDNLYSIKVYQNGNEIEEINKLPEHSLGHMLVLIGKRLVNKNA
ncbi:MAG: hypothetical protein GTN40_03935 [Candidatus Aenigmarchaeota archaeon]|nr:hypothetical protein [Candidatus Aenigmarchaeota archaeon]